MSMTKERAITLLAAMLMVAASFIAAAAASFDCNKASAPDELAICSDRALNDQDVRMAVYLEVLGSLQLMGANGAMRDEQRDWLKSRQACGGSNVCLSEAYRKRIDQLRATFKALAAQRQ